MDYDLSSSADSEVVNMASAFAHQSGDFHNVLKKDTDGDLRVSFIGQLHDVLDGIGG